MSRLSRLVIPGHPHHVTQRGNRRTQVFFEDSDYALYKDLLSEAAFKANAEIWCYCLMPNHIHLIVVPFDEDGLRRTFADAHRRYTGYINARMRVTGHLWQGRFGSVVIDEAYLAHAVRYITLNPVRAQLVQRAEDWSWSSIAAHLLGKDDGLVKVAPLLERYGDFAAFLGQCEDEPTAFNALRRSETTGRPLGSEEWIEGLEKQTSRILKPQKRGPKGNDGD
ncbi:MAG: transposase [Gammaproteobacteria bacterium]|nr:transposase [Gammaproteobacteria bacterium]MBU1656349.1 transposase [Gammaproteobacteria bacterium]MBU1959913.1 transposase [Gammaproteobacteria bacterium]